MIIIVKLNRVKYFTAMFNVLDHAQNYFVNISITNYLLECVYINELLSARSCILAWSSFHPGKKGTEFNNHIYSSVSRALRFYIKDITANLFISNSLVQNEREI